MVLVVRRFVVLTVLMSALTVVASKPAWACSCAVGPPTLGGSGAIFAGTITAKTNAWWRLWNAGTDYKIRVEQVVQGRVHRTAWVTRNGGASASCGGFYADVGEHVAVAVSGGPFRFDANLCSRIDPESVQTVGRVPRPPAPNGVGILGHWVWEGAPIILVLLLVGGFILAARRARRRRLHL
jgi:hypothetical protein